MPKAPVDDFKVWLVMARRLSLAMHLVISLPMVGLAGLAVLVFLPIGDRGIDSMAGLILLPGAIAAVLAGMYLWLVRRLWRGLGWWPLALADLALAGLGVLGVLTSPQPPSFIAIALTLSAAAMLVVVALGARSR